MSFPNMTSYGYETVTVQKSSTYTSPMLLMNGLFQVSFSEVVTDPGVNLEKISAGFANVLVNNIGDAKAYTASNLLGNVSDADPFTPPNDSVTMVIGPGSVNIVNSRTTNCKVLYAVYQYA